MDSANHRKEVGMLLRSRNTWRDLGLALLAVALILPTATTVAAVQDAEAVGQAEKSVGGGSFVAKPAKAAKPDRESLPGTPDAITPPPIQTETVIAEPASQETTSPQSLEPRVALRPGQQEGQWQASPTNGSTVFQPGALSDYQQASISAAVANSPASEMTNQATWQTPHLRMTTLGPKNANIHRTSQFRFRVTNDGPTIAQGVNLAIDISGSGRVVSTFPDGAVQQTEAIYFPVGELAVGEVKEYGFEFQADRAGQINVSPRLTSSGTTTFTANVTAPQVQIDFQGDDTFVVGQRIQQTVVIRNEGNETVRNIVVRQACTPSNAFQNNGIADGQQIIDSIAPGQSRTVAVSAIAVQQGKATMKIVVDGENVRGTKGKEFTFLQSQLTAAIEGPELTYLNSMGTYGITVTNDQARDLENIQVRLSLPIGMVVKVVDRKAEFDAASSTISWNIGKIPAGQTEQIPFKATLSQFGQHVLKASGSNAAGAMTHSQMTTQAVGRADIDVKVVTNSEPIEIGSTTSVIVQVQNKGTQPANDINVTVQLPEAFAGIASADYALNGQQVTFDGFRLTPGQTHNLTIPITCETAGDHIVRASVESSASSKAIAAENSLFFFSTRSMKNAGFQTDNQ